MVKFLDIFGFLAVLLRGLSLAFEALTLGGIIFVFAIAHTFADRQVMARNLRRLCIAALSLAVTQICVVSANSAILLGSTDLRLADLAGAGFWNAGLLVIAGGAAIALCAHNRLLRIVCPFAFLSILIGSLMTSHAIARLEHRPVLTAATLLHHLGGAAWIGGLPYLLLTLRHTPTRARAAALTARFSRLALISVAFLAGAGTAMALLYVGSAAAAVETTYGVMLIAKVILTAILLLLGALNWRIVRAIRTGGAPDVLPLRRFAEAEVGIGFTILLAAASLTSTPPAVDVTAGRVTPREIFERMRLRWPSLETPSVSQLSPATPLTVSERSTLPGSFVPGQLWHPNTPADIAWSEYNHHWAGLVVLLIGILALLSRRSPWARHWPFAFLGLAVFLSVRADSENWPLGPRGFWESFQVAEVAQHRFFVLLIVAFAVFEWAVQTHRLSRRRAGLVFPLVCAAGGALLMTHSHALDNVKEEFLAELSHLPLALFAVIAGWSRWLEIRLQDARVRLIAWIWPACFVLIGFVLIVYRES